MKFAVALPVLLLSLVLASVTHAEPSLAFAPASLATETRVGSNALSQALYIWNGGTGTLTYALSTDADWLSVTPTNGTSSGRPTNTTNSGGYLAPGRIQVNYATAGLAAGSYTGLIMIVSAEATNSPLSVMVRLAVKPNPESGRGNAPVITRIEMVDQQLTRIEWLSVTNHAYTLLRARSLGEAFQFVAGGIAATPPVNVYYDSDAGGAIFYRVVVDQP
jgi:hypothetical protein